MSDCNYLFCRPCPTCPRPKCWAGQVLEHTMIAMEISQIKSWNQKYWSKPCFNENRTMGKLCNILSDPIKFLNSVVWIWTFRKAGLHTNKWVILGQARFCNSLWCSDTHLDFKPSCHPHNQRILGCHNQSIGGAISWLRVIPEKMLRTMWIVCFSYFVK